LGKERSSSQKVNNNGGELEREEEEEVASGKKPREREGLKRMPQIFCPLETCSRGGEGDR
jgi:hypothetical protein